MADTVVPGWLGVLRGVIHPPVLSGSLRLHVNSKGSHKTQRAQRFMIPRHPPVSGVESGSVDGRRDTLHPRH